MVHNNITFYIFYSMYLNYILKMPSWITIHISKNHLKIRLAIFVCEESDRLTDAAKDLFLIRIDKKHLWLLFALNIKPFFFRLTIYCTFIFDLGKYDPALIYSLSFNIFLVLPFVNDQLIQKVKPVYEYDKLQKVRNILLKLSKSHYYFMYHVCNTEH